MCLGTSRHARRVKHGGSLGAASTSRSAACRQQPALADAGARMLGVWATEHERGVRRGAHSLVMKLMYSETHSCTVSLASLAILALFGRAFFMIRLMLAIGRNLSCSRTLLSLLSSSSPSAMPPCAPAQGAARLGCLSTAHAEPSNLASCCSKPRSAPTASAPRWLDFRRRLRQQVSGDCQLAGLASPKSERT